MEIKDKIQTLKKEKNAVILAHYYCLPEIQDIADYVGDSLNLAEVAKNSNADIILFCGVHFMGETAKILNPSKKVLLPDLNANCSLAEGCQYEEFKQFKQQHPDHLVISYINCSAEIKTLSDIICTSGNALQIVQSLPEDEKIIFAPDKNLGGYISKISGREMVLWHGCCNVHAQLNAQVLLKMKAEHPQYKVVAHPECEKGVLELADFVGSTAAMIKYISSSDEKHFIVATEEGISHKLKKDNPDKEFIIALTDANSPCQCKDMKLNTLEKVLETLEKECNEIVLSDEMIEQAKKPIIRMLDISKQLGILK